MCGIIGYIGKENAVPFLIEGLKRESYRGYDSSGIVVFGSEPVCVKAVGKLEELEKKITKAYPRGTIGIGHCLPADTLVQMADGRVKKISSVKDGEEVYSLDPQKLSFSTGKVRVSKHRSPSYLREIRTPSAVLEVTDRHRLFVWGEEGLEEREAKDISAGDILVFPKHIKRRQTGRKLTFQNIPVKTYNRVSPSLNTLIKERISLVGMSMPRLASSMGVAVHDLEHMIQNDRNVRTDVLEKVLPSLSIDVAQGEIIPRHSIHGNFVTLPNRSSPELMQIIGYYLGDGHAGERTLRFKDMRKEVLERYQQLCKTIFNLEGRITTMSDTVAYLLEINSIALAKWLKKNVRQRREELIEEVGSMPRDEIRAFLRGLFDAEGTIAEEAHQIVMGITDKLLARTIQLLLLQFGILSSVSDSNTGRPSHWKLAYRLAISSCDSIEKFLAHVGFASKEKQKKGGRLPFLMSRQTSVSFKFLPYRKRVLYEKCTPFISKLKLKSLLGSPGNLKSFARESTTRKILACLEKINDPKAGLLAEELKTFLNGDILFQQVTSSTKKKSSHEFLYDLEVTPNNNFFANGILSHNSRWATHGGVTEANAHPHQDCKGNIFVVHNGIIENYRELKEKVETKGHTFVSQTDTEVIPHLIEHFFKGDLSEATRKTLQLVRGTYGIAVIAKEDPGKIVAARMASPLVLSVNGKGGFVASDPSALLSHSSKMIFLDDGEIAVIKENEFLVTDLQNNPRPKEAVELEWTVEEAQKGGQPHFMLKEIMEQPESVENSIRGRLLIQEGRAKLGGLEAVEKRLRDIQRLNIIACGTSYYAGLAGEYMLEEYAGIPTDVDFASEFRYRKAIVDQESVFLFISQSGETADTLAALKEVKGKGGLTLGIVNVVSSSVARETDAGVYNHAGPEIGVASTKAFTSQLAVLALLTLFLGRQRGLSLVMGQRIAKEIARLPELIGQVLQSAPLIEKLAEKYKEFQNFLYIGRKYNYPVALEGALKLKEISYVHAEGYGGGEMKHGPIALIDERFPTLAICPSDSVYEKMVSNIQEIKARNGPVIAVATEGNEDLKMIADDVVYIPKTLEMLTPILAVIPLQLFAYSMAVGKGNDPDKPRNLAKSVTVE